ncbi:MAG: hypothetical protein GWN93_20865 [Deltaproteobacteria bacterium]|nr:hypothetical protein [Deltaproteobacteria bacterium]
MPKPIEKHLKAMKHVKQAYKAIKQVIASYHNLTQCPRKDLIEKALYHLQLAYQNTEPMDGIKSKHGGKNYGLLAGL